MSILTEANQKLTEPLRVRQEIVGSGGLIYEMVKTEIVIDEHIRIVYGIGITSSLFGENESCLIRDISSSYEKVSDLFDIVVSKHLLM